MEEYDPAPIPYCKRSPCYEGPGFEVPLSDPDSDSDSDDTGLLTYSCSAPIAHVVVVRLPPVAVAVRQ